MSANLLELPESISIKAEYFLKSDLKFRSFHFPLRPLQFEAAPFMLNEMEDARYRVLGPGLGALFLTGS